MKKESLPRHDADAVPFMWAGMAITITWMVAIVFDEAHMVNTSLLVASGLLLIGGLIHTWRYGA